MRFLITGGAGFIGSALVRYILTETEHSVLVLDKLTYAGNLASLAPVAGHPGFRFVQADICDAAAVEQAFREFQPDKVMHLAAESHVDRSIEGPAAFVQTNIVGTSILLEAARAYWQGLPAERAATFLFHHISTDEVYGDLAHTGALFTEQTPYAPSSPYSASKAGSDHLVRAWGRTYGLPFVITNCSNNYGPYHFPEKLVPHMIISALQGRSLPVYGDGRQIRDWLYVDDHARALLLCSTRGVAGETYNIGGHNEKTNLEVVQTLCRLLEQVVPAAQNPSLSTGQGYTDLITFVEDRPGHDQRYAIDAGKIERELGWKPKESFASGMVKTVDWYLANKNWWQAVLSGEYRLQRLGQAATASTEKSIASDRET